MKSRLIKYDGKDKYIFINGVTQIPGTTHKKFKITLKEFNETKQQLKLT